MAGRKYHIYMRKLVSAIGPALQPSVVAGILMLAFLLCGPSSVGAQLPYRRRLDRLKTHLLSNYSKAFAPLHNDRDLFLVTVSFTLVSILDMNDADQVLTTLSYITVDWTDPDLAWNSSEVGSPGEGIEVIGVTPQDIWTPKLMLLNRVTTDKSQVIDEYESITLFGRTGFCQAHLPLHVSTTCQMDVTYYPFDTQYCQVIFSSVPGEQLNVSAKHLNLPLLSIFDVSGEWELMNITIAPRNITDKPSNFFYTFVEFQLTLRRRYYFYVLTVIFPMMLLSITGACGFLLPLQCGEKVSFQVAIMVSLAVFLSFINDAMPKTSLTVSRLAVYLDLLLMQSCLSFLATTVVLRGHYHHEKLEQDEKDEKYLNAARGAREPGEQTVRREGDPAFSPADGSSGWQAVSSRWKRFTTCLRRMVRRWYCGCCCIPPSALDIFFFIIFMSIALGSPFSFFVLYLIRTGQNVQQKPEFEVMFASLPGDVLNVSAERLDVPLLETFDVSGEWEQIDFTVIHSNLAIELHNISHNYVGFQLTLRRRSDFYELTVIFPMMLLSITGACGFLLPLQCGEKVNFQVAIMVSLAVFLGFIYDAIPKTSLTVSRLAVYLDLLLLQSCLSFLATTVVLRGHYHHEKLEQDEKDEKYLNAARGAREPGEQTIKREDDPALTPA